MIVQRKIMDGIYLETKKAVNRDYPFGFKVSVVISYDEYLELEKEIIDMGLWLSKPYGGIELFGHEVIRTSDLKYGDVRYVVQESK